MNGEREPPKAAGARKPHAAQFTVFRFVVQTDYPHQMDVFRWLISDSAYTVVWILHDRDRYSLYDMDEQTGYKYHVRKGWDHVQQFHVDDLKPAHIHGIVKCGRKCTPETMSGRFGQYVTFQGVSDVQQCALYLTHRTFDARNKFQYPEFAVQGDLDYYAECAGLGQTECDMCRRWLGYCAAARDNFIGGGVVDSGAIFALAVKLAIAAGDKSLVKNVMSHSYFYKNLQ